MKHFNTKFLRSMLIIACTFCMPFLTVKAQPGGNLVPLEKRWISTAGYDKLNNPTDSAVFIWTKNGYHVPKETYNWEKGQRQLSETGVIVSDTGNEFTYEITSVDDEDVVMRSVCKFNAKGEPERFEMYMIMEGEPPMLLSTTTWQFWYASNNRMDSILQTSTFTIPFPPYTQETWIKSKYITYDADGRVTLIENHIKDGTYTEEKSTYYKNGSGKLERQEHESYLYNSVGGALQKITKEITYYDAIERVVRAETFDGTATGVDPEYSNYIIYHYGTNVGISSPGLLAQPVVVSMTDGRLVINSMKAERIEIYSISGTKVYTNLKTPGETQISLNSLSQGIYLVKGSSGWVKKIKK